MASSHVSSPTPSQLDDFFFSAALAGRRSVVVAESGRLLGVCLNATERIVDVLTIIAAVYCAYVLNRVLGSENQEQYPASAVLLSAAAFGLLFVILLERHGGYRPYVSLLAVRETERILRVTVESFLLALLFAYFTTEHVSFVDDDPQKSGLEIYESAYQRKRAAKVLAGPVCPELLRQLAASVLVIATPGSDRDSMLRLASAAGVDTYFVREDFSEPSFWIDYAELDGIMLAHLSKGQTRIAGDSAKRVIDLAISMVLLALLAPLFALIAILVKSTSPGQVLFQQERVGKDGRLFPMYKFRTMYCDAPQYSYSPGAGDDPRITPAGRFLRRTSLDELPQLVNVLLGHMSLGGPRPEMPFIVEQYTPLQRRRLGVKPGITGLWQLSADRAFLIHENIEYDLYYVRNRSLSMDVAILLHTVLFAARGV